MKYFHKKNNSGFMDPAKLKLVLNIYIFFVSVYLLFYYLDVSQYKIAQQG